MVLANVTLDAVDMMALRQQPSGSAVMMDCSDEFAGRGLLWLMKTRAVYLQNCDVAGMFVAVDWPAAIRAMAAWKGEEYLKQRMNSPSLTDNERPAGLDEKQEDPVRDTVLLERMLSLMVETEVPSS